MILNNHIAEIDANPKGDAPLLWKIPLTLHHAALDLHSAAHGIHDARELRQETIAGVLYGTAPVLFDLWLNELFKPGFPGWIGPAGPKAAEMLVKPSASSFTRRVRQNSAT